jgi:hypothetical protein
LKVIGTVFAVLGPKPGWWPDKLVPPHRVSGRKPSLGCVNTLHHKTAGMSNHSSNPLGNQHLGTEMKSSEPSAILFAGASSGSPGGSPHRILDFQSFFGV